MDCCTQWRPFTTFIPLKPRKGMETTIGSSSTADFLRFIPPKPRKGMETSVLAGKRTPSPGSSFLQNPERGWKHADVRYQVCPASSSFLQNPERGWKHIVTLHRETLCNVHSSKTPKGDGNPLDPRFLERIADRSFLQNPERGWKHKDLSDQEIFFVKVHSSKTPKGDGNGLRLLPESTSLRFIPPKPRKGMETLV